MPREQFGEHNSCAVGGSWTWKDRLRYKLFPSRHADLPEAPANFADVLEVRVDVGLDAMDRLRVLLTGKLHVQTRVVCENRVGDTRSNSMAYPVLGFKEH